MRASRRLVVLSLALALSLSGWAMVRAAPSPPPRPIAITVDDLPVSSQRLHPSPAGRRALTERLLAVFRRQGVSATGYVVGRNILGPEDEENLRAWLEAGHDLGNHTWNHLDLCAVAADSFIADAERCRLAVDRLARSYGGRAVRSFRFPYLREGETPAKRAAVLAHLERTGQRNAHVTIDDQDWSFEEAWVAARQAGDTAALARIGAEYQRALQLAVAHHEASGDRLFNRTTPQILLLHANEVGAAQWDSLFTWLVRTNHRFVPLDSVLADPAFAVPHDFTASYGCSLWDRLWADRRDAAAREAVTTLLRTQCDAWSRGDIDAFCSVYEDSALFISPNGLTRGREAVRDRYRAKYPGRAAMGTLALDIVEMRPVSGREISLLGDAVPGRVQGMSVAARWTLSFPSEPGADPRPPATGHTLILLRPTPRGWVIVQDASM